MSQCKCCAEYASIPLDDLIEDAIDMGTEWDNGGREHDSDAVSHMLITLGIRVRDEIGRLRKLSGKASRRAARRGAR